MKRVIKKLFNKIGLQVERFNSQNSHSGWLVKILNDHGINLVVDVGANTGQFAESLLSIGYGGNLLSFEPLTQAHNMLELASKKYKNWEVFERCAIGEESHNTLINIASNSVSSSILPMLSAHELAAPDSYFNRAEEVIVYRLDEVLKRYLHESSKLFIKIDTQGYEWIVMNGLTGILDKVFIIELELSLLPLYEGQHLWLDFIERLDSYGFQLWGLHPAFNDMKTGRTLQFDGLFVRV